MIRTLIKTRTSSFPPSSRNLVYKAYEAILWGVGLIGYNVASRVSDKGWEGYEKYLKKSLECFEKILRRTAASEGYAQLQRKSRKRRMIDRALSTTFDNPIDHLSPAALGWIARGNGRLRNDLPSTIRSAYGNYVYCIKRR